MKTIEITAKQAYELMLKNQGVLTNDYQQPSSNDPMVITAEYSESGKLVRIVRLFPPCF